MKKSVRLLFAIIISIMLLFSLFACDWAQTKDTTPESIIADTSGSEEPLSDRFDLTNNVLQYIIDNYYGDIDYDRADIYAAYGLISSLGNYNYIYSATDLLASGTDGKGFGLLVRNTLYNEHIVDCILENSPFLQPYEDHQVERGDEIYKIENVRMSGLDSSSYASFISSLPSDREVTFTMKRGDTFYDVKYQKVKMTFPTCYYIDDLPGNVPKEFGYICLRSFDSSGNVLEEFQNAVKSYLEDGNSALILDLRGNGGGSSDVFSYIASALIGDVLAGETLLEVHYEKQDYYSHIESKEVEYKVNSPVYVLCDGATASASEALIGTMKAHGTLTALIGKKTVGKGVAQNSPSLSNEGKGYIVDKVYDEESGMMVEDVPYLLQIVVGKYYIYDSSVEGGKYCMHEKPFEPDFYVTEENVISPDYSEDLYIQAAIRAFTQG